MTADPQPMPRRVQQTRATRGSWRFPCTVPGCGRVFKSKQAVSVHRYQAHGINSSEPRAARKRRQKAREAGLPATEPHICICGLGFPTRTAFANHRIETNHYTDTELAIEHPPETR